MPNYDVTHLLIIKFAFYSFFFESHLNKTICYKENFCHMHCQAPIHPIYLFSIIQHYFDLIVIRKWLHLTFIYVHTYFDADWLVSNFFQSKQNVIFLFQNIDEQVSSFSKLMHNHEVFSDHITKLLHFLWYIKYSTTTYFFRSNWTITYDFPSSRIAKN